MANLIEHRKFIAASVENNNNRFWEYKFFDDDTIIVTYGRMGITETTDPAKPMTRKKLDALIRTKTKSTSDRPGYKLLDTVGDSIKTTSTGSLSNEKLKELAKAELAGSDPVLQDLIGRLAEANKHELLASTGGAIDVDTSTGIVTAAGGIVVSQKSISEARILLDNMSNFVIQKDLDNKQYMQTLSDYMMLIPQRVPMQRGWHKSYITDSAGLQKQNSLLDQLETSVTLVQQRIDDALKAPTANKVAAPAMFNTKVSIVTDTHIINDITKFFNAGVNNIHMSRNLRPIRIYKVEIQKVIDGYESYGKIIGNPMRLWHGTRTFNVLSILKNGPVVPPSTASHVCGRMFGDGFYMSDQATKSLNYSQGYWSGATDNNCFMFLCEAAMGKVYKPSRSGNSMVTGYNSCFAEAGKSGVQNNEMIVPDTRQVLVEYLVEFSPK